MNMPNFIDGLKEGQKKFGEDIARVVNFLLLFAVYILGVGLTSIIAKIFKYNFLEVNFAENSKSYWVDLDLPKNKMEDSYRQF